MYKQSKKKQQDQTKKAELDELFEQKFSPDEFYLRQLFAKSADIFFESYTFQKEKLFPVLISGCKGLVDIDLQNRILNERISAFLDLYPDHLPDKQTMLSSLHLPSIKEITNEEELIDNIFSGSIILLFKGCDVLFSVDFAKRPQRSPEETSTEVSLRGPRDNFIEDVAVNCALIRKRMRTQSLHIEQFESGTRTKTVIAVLYVKDIANPEIIQGIRDKIKQIDVDGIYSGNQLMELIEKPAPLYPRFHYTGRPDTAVHSLLKGRILILIDGVAYAVITPANLFLLLKSGEDTEYTSIYASFERILRIFGLFIAALLPGFWVAVTTFHQDQIPLILLATVVESRRGLPLPSSVEAIVMVLMFEIFREAGVRLPPTIGTTLSVLGGLIIGDAAIRSGLTSPAMLVVISASFVATFTLVNQSLIGAISVLRLISIAFGSFLGLFGYFFSLLFILVHLSSIRTFGVPYLELTANLNIRNVLKVMLRFPAKAEKRRPVMLSPEDPTEKGGEND